VKQSYCTGNKRKKGRRKNAVYHERGKKNESSIDSSMRRLGCPMPSCHLREKKKERKRGEDNDCLLVEKEKGVIG